MANLDYIYTAKVKKATTRLQQQQQAHGKNKQYL